MQLLATNIKSASLITAFLLLTLPGLGQDRMYVTAKSGLIVRESPSLESKKLYTLKHNTMVLISEKTGVKITIKDEDQEIHGEWLKVLSLDHDDTQGYVFSGFLTSEIPEIWYSQRMPTTKAIAMKIYKRVLLNQKHLCKIFEERLTSYSC